MNTFEILLRNSCVHHFEHRPSSSLNRWIIHQTQRLTWNFIFEGGEEGGGRENRSAISRNTWRNFPRGWIPRGASRTNERIRMNACRTMDWLARARNDFIIYLGHDRFQCANRNCLLRRSGGAVNVASSSSRREWQFVSPIKLIASVRDWSRCSDRARSLGTEGVASSPRSSKRMMGWEI